MSDLIQELEKAELRDDVLDFAPGDTVRVLYNVREGPRNASRPSKAFV
jgi:ribosomal protein L19